jgi:hypothetical protein
LLIDSCINNAREDSEFSLIRKNSEFRIYSEICVVGKQLILFSIWVYMEENKNWKKRYYNEKTMTKILEAILKVVSADALNMRVAPRLLGEAEKGLAYLDKRYPKRYPPWLREFWRKAIERRKQHEQKIQEQKKEQKMQAKI